MKITIATKWQELNKWQKRQIARLYLTTALPENEKTPLELVRILFQKGESLWAIYQFKKLLSQVPFSRLEPYTHFLYSSPALHQFPAIKGLDKPADRLANLTMKQFSVADALFYRWREQKKDVFLRQLIASLYVLPGKSFNSLCLPKTAEITDKINPNDRYLIGLTYFSVREYIVQKYPIVFPKQKKNTQEQELQPTFKKKPHYVPFSKVIASMAMDERQPLGNLSQCHQTLLYDFLNMLEESIIRHQNEKQ